MRVRKETQTIAEKKTFEKERESERKMCAPFILSGIFIRVGEVPGAALCTHTHMYKLSNYVLPCDWMAARTPAS